MNHIRTMQSILIFSLISTSASFSQEENTDKNHIETKNIDKITISGFSTKLDELNRNLYTIDQDMIQNKGYNSTEQIISYIPFTGFSNTGMGQNIDLRGQGSSANVNTQVLYNGIPLNMLDSSHGVTPLNTINVNDIESIEILPGGGAVMYGNGTRGGVVNIITKKRYEKLSIDTGINYIYSDGSNPQVNFRIGDKITKGLYYSLSGRYGYQEGYRKGDLKHIFNIGGNLTWDLNEIHSLYLDVNYYRGLVTTTPVLRFSEIKNPSKSDGTKAGDGDIHMTQDRVSASLNYDIKPNEHHKINIKTFFQYYNSYYDRNIQNFYGYTYQVFQLPGKTSADQQGSYFTDIKTGLEARYDLKHKNGIFMLGLDSIFNQGIRKLNFQIDWSGVSLVGNTSINSYNHQINSYVTAKKWSNSIYAIEKYNFTDSFSLTGGGRYELSWYGGYRTLDNHMLLQMTTLTDNKQIPITSIYNLQKDISDLRHNFALEFIPKYTFSIGDAYFKYERGFRSPNPDNLTYRSGTGSKNNYLDTNVKSETYDTFELGTKLFANDHAMFLATFFYTLTQNEIYTIGSPHTGAGFKVGNYGLTQRTGIEIASEQNFFNNSLSFNESFTYIDARILQGSAEKGKKGELIPYVSNYKATLGINYNFNPMWKVWIQNSFIGSQRDIAQNKIKAYSLTDIGVDFKIKHFSISAGIRNLFDTFYYTFYNQDKSDEIIGYAFLIGQGRSYFIEGRYRF